MDSIMPSEPMIAIHANGQTRQVRDGLSLNEFITRCGFRPGQVVVEYNGDALNPGEMSAISLHEGDSLEVVRIVAGG